jgi:cytochrome P450
LKDYLPIMSARVQESLDRWRTRFAGTSFPVNRELLALSFRITCSTLFHYLPSFEEAEEFADAIWVLQSDGMKRYLAGGDYTPWIPLPQNRRVNRARAALIRLAQKAVDHGAGQPLDEILSILFAGTESPVNTLCFALKLLEDHPGWHEKLLAELARKAPASPFEDIESFDLLSQVISESVRLYPAGWAFERYAAEDVQLGGELVRKGSRLLFSPFLMHRNSRFWREPARFDPLRFTAGPNAVEGVPKYGYMPFGAGPRSCIGSRLALAEMRITLSMILAQCRWTTERRPGDPPLDAEGSFKIRLPRPLVVTMDFHPTDKPPKTLFAN